MRILKLSTVVALALAGCGSNDTVQIASVHVKSQRITAATGGLIEVSAAEHARLAGTRLEIPANALAQDTTITVGISSDSLADDEADGSGPVVELGPDGTQFSTPIHLSIPYDGELDEDLVRVFVVESSGARTVVLPDALTYDAASKTLTLEVSHFTRFQGGRGHRPCSHVRCPSGQCRRGRCIPAVDCSLPNACGPELDVATLMCRDGSLGGFTGRCLPNQARGCQWEIRECPADCDANECGPAPGLPNYVCPDGTIAGPTECRRNADGRCGFEIVSCQNPTACMTDRECGVGRCENGVCSNNPPPPACTQRECGPAPALPNFMCPDGMTIAGPTDCRRHADGRCGYDIISCPNTGACMSDRECPPDAACDPAAGRCVPRSNACTSDRDCGLGACINGVCGNTPPPACTAQECGPAPGVPNTMCSDGSVGGPTGCYRHADGRCGYDIRQCPPSRCMSDRECPADGHCDLNLAQCVPNNPPPACRADADCPAGTACDAASMQCVRVPPPPACMTDRDCPLGAACDPSVGQCVRVPPPPPQCMSDRECPADAHCDLNVGQCVPNNPPLMCRVDIDCPSGAVCDQNTHSCVRQPPPPPACMSDRECAAGQACVNGVCGASPAQCTAQECGPAPALPNYTCPDGMTIAGPTACFRHADGRCGYDIVRCPEVRCMSDRECGANQACVNGLCQ